jgi:hypothetical protein
MINTLILRFCNLIIATNLDFKYFQSFLRWYSPDLSIFVYAVTLEIIYLNQMGNMRGRLKLPLRKFLLFAPIRMIGKLKICTILNLNIW